MCGIFGYVGVEKPLDKRAFLTLGCINDTRGGDSTGIFIDGKVEYGVEKLKFFQDFFYTSNLIQETNKAKVALGHCRKASVGGISLNTAQPVVIKDADGEIEFVLIHNGTIVNYKELSRKYLKGESVGLTDSQIMAKIIHSSGFNVLKEYIGAGAFVITDYRESKEKPTTYLFKGESLLNSYSKEPVEERPLFISIEKKGIWFSSISLFLSTTRYGSGDVFFVKPNHLYTIKEGEIRRRELYDRSKQYQTEPTVKVTHGSVRNSEDFDWDGYEGYGYNHFFDRDYTNSSESQVPAIGFKSNQSKGASIFVTDVFCNPTYNSKNKMTFIDGFYYLDGKRAHGKYPVSKYGYIMEATFSRVAVELYFYEGIIVYDKKCFDVILKLQDTLGISNSKEFAEGFPEIIYPYSPLLYYDKKEKRYIRYDRNMHTPFWGDFNVLFETTEPSYHFEKGKIKTRCVYPQTSNSCVHFEKFLEEKKKYENIDVEYEYKDFCDWLGYYSNAETN